MECQWWFFLCNKDNDEKWLFPQVNRKMVHKYYAKISIYIYSFKTYAYENFIWYMPFK